MERNFSATYQRHLNKIKIENAIKEQKNNKPTNSSRWESSTATIFDVLKLMEIKSKQLVFQSFDPKDFGADYDIVSIPKDNTPEADFWLNETTLK